jgi:hypothetical protein
VSSRLYTPSLLVVLLQSLVEEELRYSHVRTQSATLLTPAKIVQRNIDIEDEDRRGLKIEPMQWKPWGFRTWHGRSEHLTRTIASLLTPSSASLTSHRAGQLNHPHVDMKSRSGLSKAVGTCG